jgi:UDPglucose--hexose-1-phosphate uridylyltransferase
MSQIRYDLYRDRYVIIAPERAQRPGFLVASKVELPKNCPFCEGNESLTPPEIYALRDGSGSGEKGWKTRVVPNLFKAVAIEASLQKEREGSFERQGGFGAHEIVIDMPRHEMRMDQWSEEEFKNWLLTLQERTVDLHRDFRLVYLSIFKNNGANAAATQSHPHTQIVALPLIPKAILAQLSHHVAYFRQQQRVLIDVLRDEESAKSERVVVENDHFVAIAPFASAMPFEIWVVSKGRLASLIAMQEAEMEALSALLRTLFIRLYRVLGYFDFNLDFEMAPLQKDGASETLFDYFSQICRLGIRITPRITGLGGFELATGMHINPVSPEEAAKRLREATP